MRRTERKSWILVVLHAARRLTCSFPDAKNVSRFVIGAIDTVRTRSTGRQLHYVRVSTSLFYVPFSFSELSSIKKFSTFEIKLFTFSSNWFVACRVFPLSRSQFHRWPWKRLSSEDLSQTFCNGRYRTEHRWTHTKIVGRYVYSFTTCLRFAYPVLCLFIDKYRFASWHCLFSIYRIQSRRQTRGITRTFWSFH